VIRTILNETQVKVGLVISQEHHAKGIGKTHDRTRVEGGFVFLHQQKGLVFLHKSSYSCVPRGRFDLLRHLMDSNHLRQAPTGGEGFWRQQQHFAAIAATTLGSTRFAYWNVSLSKLTWNDLGSVWPC
jgi:hypothetical protein